MLRQRITILLIGLICFNFVSGFLTVICHGSDGDITVKYTGHSVCKCTDDVEVEIPTKAILDDTTDHKHCNDFIASSDIIPTKKELKHFINKGFTTFFTSHLISEQISPIYSRSIEQSTELSPFFMPLQTIILLA